MPPPLRSFGAPAACTEKLAEQLPKYDDSQLAVIECPDQKIVAEARAGAGKTYTAIGYAAARPKADVLYVCFGKANQLEAIKRFGPNVECRTGHSLAFGAVGYKYKDQLVPGGWTARGFANELEIDVRTAAALQDVLTQFFTSIDRDIQPHHVAVSAKKWDISESDYEEMVALARKAWAKMKVIGGGVKMPPDAYLKIWALTKPKLKKFPYIVLDEGQDTNPVMAEIIEDQSHAHILVIGDRHQGIFAFRNALNAMEQFAAAGATVLVMPKTWRFGQEIADVSNKILGLFKNEQTRIIGAGPGSPKRPGVKRAVLSRTNSGLFAEAAAVMGKNTHWLGGIERYRIDVLKDSFLLKSGRRSEIRDAGLRHFASWQQFKDETEKTRDVQGRMLIKLNEQYGADIPNMVESFRQNALPTEAGAHLVLSTGHSAKGLDWDYVTVGEDFECLNKALDQMRLYPNERLSQAHEQEINLLYVVATRARYGLTLNRETNDFLRNFQRHQGEFQEARARMASHQGATHQAEAPSY